MTRSILALVFTSLCLGGCTVSRYERTVTIERAPTGAITSIVEVEHMTQSGKRKKLPTRFLYDKEIGAPAQGDAGEGAEQ